jgi:hypothetical protein
MECRDNVRLDIAPKLDTWSWYSSVWNWSQQLPFFLWIKLFTDIWVSDPKINQSFILTLRPQKCSRHPATRITLDARLPPLPVPSPSVHIIGQPPSLYCRVGVGYHGRGGRLDGGRRVLLLSLSSYQWHGGGGCDSGSSIFLCEAGLVKTPA